MSCHNGYPRALVTDDGNGPVFTGVRRNRLPTLPRSRSGSHRCDPIGRRRRRPDDRQSWAIRSGAAARGVHAMPSRVDERPAAVPDPPLRTPAVFICAGKAAGGLLHSFRPCGGRRPGGQVRNRGSRVPPAEVGVLSAQRHDVPHLSRPARHSAGREAVQRYVAICQSCHQGTHRSGMPHSPDVPRSATCLDCHMPKRRTEDAVHVVMTDHYIQRRRPAADLLAPRRNRRATSIAARCALLPATARVDA